MLRISLTAWLFLYIASASGCRMNVDATGPPDPEKLRLQRQVKKLHAKLDKSETDTALLRARVKELVERENELTQLVGRLKFLKKQQDDEIAVLRRAPAQRDRYKADVERLTGEIIRLRGQLEALRARAPATAPTTKPAGGS